VPAVINVVRTYRSAQGQDATGLSALRVGLTRVWAVWAAVFTVLSIIAYTLLILNGSSSHSSSHSSIPRGPVALPVAVNVPLGTTEAITALAPNETSQEPATLQMSDLVYPAAGSSPNTATARARLCAGAKAIDPLSGVVGVSLVDSSGRDHSDFGGEELAEAFYGPLAPHACLAATLSFTVPSGTTPRSLTLLSTDLNTINWSAS
jgi:hypothetical protein